MTGKVYLVGAGPGDCGLFTLHGVECLGAADVVLYDYLVNPALLALVPEGAEIILVGKRHGREEVSQECINAMLVENAKAGKVVVRLKGGDPFVFGRGGEEIQFCREAGVPLEVVPGVTSAVAVPAYAGIPLTHRDYSSLVTIVTGSPGERREDFHPDWDRLAGLGGTLVFLMAMLHAEQIGRGLVAAGMSSDCPAAVITKGTLPSQRSVVCSLADLAQTIRERRLKPPGVIVIGEVAALGGETGWFEKRPLFGRSIVVTRASHQAGELSRLLESQGAEVLEYPTIEIREPLDPEPIEQALDGLANYDWLVLTSVNGALRFFDALLGSGRDIRDLAGVKVAAIGPATAAAVEERGIRIAVQPTEYRAEALLDVIDDVRGKRILLARAAVARDLLPETLLARGAEVDVVPLYRTVVPDLDRKARERMLEDLGRADMVTFASSSAARNFDTMNGGKSAALLSGRRVAAIGPVTAATLRELGVEAAVIPKHYTIPELAKAIAEFFAKRGSLK
ncbi:MAG: uroporphyrinogen-III C-methyltransferase [Candidatus Binatia bacterium]